jgi:hypothetical protein
VVIGNEGVVAVTGESDRVVGGDGAGLGVLAVEVDAACDGGGVAPVSQLQFAGIAETGGEHGKSGVVKGEGKAEKDCERGDSWKSSFPSFTRSSSTSHLRLAALLVRFAGGEAMAAGEWVYSGKAGVGVRSTEGGATGLGCPGRGGGTIVSPINETPIS